MQEDSRTNPDLAAQVLRVHREYTDRPHDDMVDVRTTLPDGDIVEQVPPFRQPPQPPRRYSLPLGANPSSALIRVNPEEASDKGTNRVILTKLAGLLRRRGAGGTPHDRLLDRDAGLLVVRIEGHTAQVGTLLDRVESAWRPGHRQTPTDHHFR